MTEPLYQTSLCVNNTGKVVSAKDAEKIVQATLEARAAEVLNVLNEKTDALEKMVTSLKSQKIEMDLRWAGEYSFKEVACC